MDINGIMAQLPHRYPFLLVDRVVSFEPHKTLTAYKNVTFNEHFFQGHFPGRPVMPGVLIMEALAQAGGILTYLSFGPDMAGKITYIMAMDKVKFRRPVVPGDRLDLRVEVIRLGTKYWKLHGEASVDGQKAAEGDLMAANDAA
ncbi:MAG: 3-hydroxyacyl-ACP dehydratase FabZ [Pseudomonadota bacterium]